MKRNIWLFYIFSFLSNALFWSAVLIPFLKGWGGLSQTKIQILQSWFMLSMFLMEVPTGMIADIFGKKISLILGALMPIFGNLVYTSSPNSFYIYFLGEFLFGLGYAFRSGADSAFIYELLREEGNIKEAKKIFRRIESLKLAGILVGALLGSWLTIYFSPRDVIFLTTIPMILCLGASLFLSEPKKQETGEVSRWTNIFREGSRDILKNSKLRILGIDAIYLPSMAYFVMWLYQPKLELIGVPMLFFGIFHAVLGLSQIFVLQGNAMFEKMLGGEKSYLTKTVIFVIVGFLAVAVFHHWSAVLFFILFTGGFGLTRRVVLLAEINKHIDSSRRATTNSFVNMMREMFIVVLNPIIGMIADYRLNFAFITLALLSFGGLFITIKAQRNMSNERIAVEPQIT